MNLKEQMVELSYKAFDEKVFAELKNDVIYRIRRMAESGYRETSFKRVELTKEMHRYELERFLRNEGFSVDTDAYLDGRFVMTIRW